MQYSVEEADPLRCPASQPEPNQLANSEKIGRVLYSAIAPSGVPDERTFPICDLLLERVGAVDHDCGNSDGVSVQRAPPATLEKLILKSQELAARKPGRTAGGVAFTLVSVLRSIKIPGVSGQVVFVLTDGSDADPGHAVIRMSPQVPDGLRKKVRKDIIDAFRSNIIPAS